jgi:hypothetical protein
VVCEVSLWDEEALEVSLRKKVVCEVSLSEEGVCEVSLSDQWALLPKGAQNRYSSCFYVFRKMFSKLQILRDMQ